METETVERTDEICADEPTNTANGAFIEEHGPICGRNLYREVNNPASTELTCSECGYYLTVTRSFGPDECPECGTELDYDEEEFSEERLFCRIHGEKIPTKGQIERNIRERENGNSPFQYIDVDS